jgi:hypothetical protein
MDLSQSRPLTGNLAAATLVLGGNEFLGGRMRTKFARAVMAISTVTIIGSAGIVTANASTSAHRNTHRSEHLRVMSTKATSHKQSAIATGAFTAGGYDKPVNATTDTLVFPAGTLTFTHVAKTVIANFNPSTCLISETQKGSFTMGHGTGTYAGIRVSGRFVSSIVAVGTKNHAGRCTHVDAPPIFQGVTTATGTVRR